MHILLLRDLHSHVRLRLHGQLQRGMFGVWEWLCDNLHRFLYLWLQHRMHRNMLRFLQHDMRQHVEKPIGNGEFPQPMGIRLMNPVLALR